ncbi:hypothetical protein [Herbaspirillum huttiense]|uniref:hypothetical protein n=1 Tax=Herbaspirillum huttiense TaxID=863372 RepID=UPI001AE1643F
MIFRSFLPNALRVLALLGAILFIVSGPDYLRGTIYYGLLNDWHFQHVAGWGFRFASWCQLLMLGLLAVSPFWIFVKNDSPAKFLPNRHIINLMVGFGLIFFLLSVSFEMLLKNHFP